MCDNGLMVIRYVGFINSYSFGGDVLLAGLRPVETAMIKWRLELVVTETDEIVIGEFKGSETYANSMLDKYVKHFENKGYTVGGGLEKVDE